MKPKLFARIDRPDPTWFTKSHVHEFYIPTEVVVSKPEIVTPRVGRYYEIDLYVWHNKPAWPEQVSWSDVKLIPYDELRQLQDFEGTAREVQVCLYEIWGNYGSDGHTRYDLICWMLHPGPCKDCEPFQMHEHFYDRFRQRQPH